VTVVLYHAGVTWLSGGFVGADVFFVISGYLIGDSCSKLVFCQCLHGLWRLVEGGFRPPVELQAHCCLRPCSVLWAISLGRRIRL
jgi:hypothetical protein